MDGERQNHFFDASQFVALCAAVVGLVGPVSGCASGPVPTSATPAANVSFSARTEGNVNPLFVKTDTPAYLWEAIVDVLDTYFPKFREYPVQSFRSVNADGTESVVRTEGRIDTEPVIAAGLLEPWKKNSVCLDQRIEATFQTIRRSASVRVVPEENGFLVHLAVYNELENLPQPAISGMSGTNLLFYDDLSQLQLPVGETASAEGWIPTGRDFELEQYILTELAWRLKNPPGYVNPENAEKIVP